MDNLDRREWLLTNGLGGFASGSICDARTRTYHGWLIAALNPPLERTLLLSHCDATLTVGDKTSALGTNFWSNGSLDPLGYQMLESFTIDPIPTWIWHQDDWRLTRRLIMPSGYYPPFTDDIKSRNRILIQYIYEGQENAILRLRPLIIDRDFHQQQLAQFGMQFSQQIADDHILFQAFNQQWRGTPWQLRWCADIPRQNIYYQTQGHWYFNYQYPEEKQRGLADKEDLYNPGYLTVILTPGENLVLEAKVGLPELTQVPLKSSDFDQVLQAEETRLHQIFALSNIDKKLLKAGDQFITYKSAINGPTIIAGYPWFNDWGRDTLIALPGLTLSTKRFDIAKGLLETFGKYCENGLIPNTFPDGDFAPIYNSIDASLWWIETLGLYVEATEDYDFLEEQYPVFRQIYKAFMSGTNYNIRVDAIDGLLMWDAPRVAITWMDVVLDGKPITPRKGKNIEINALWYSALCWGCKWSEILQTRSIVYAKKLHRHNQNYQQQLLKVKKSLQKFWNPEIGYFYDLINPDDIPDAKIRPNAVLALGLYHCGFTESQAKSVLKIASDRLLTPFGLRSLAPDDPDYIGIYEGDQEHRDSAYHQGTVWSWLIGAFIRGWKKFCPDEKIPFDWEKMLIHFTSETCLGSVSEIFDGDPPHCPQGTIAQAWSVAELIRSYDQ